MGRAHALLVLVLATSGCRAPEPEPGTGAPAPPAAARPPAPAAPTLPASAGVRPAFVDASDKLVPGACRGGEGGAPAGTGFDGLLRSLAGGVAVLEAAGDGPRTVIATGPGLRRPCVLAVRPDGGTAGAEPPAGSPEEGALGLSVVDGREGPEVVLLGQGRIVRWARRPDGGLEARPVELTRGPGLAWTTVWHDLAAHGPRVTLIGLGAHQLDADLGCYDHAGEETPCRPQSLQPGTTLIGPSVAAPKALPPQPLWAGWPGASVASAFAFGPDPGVFVTDLLGADHVFRFPPDRGIVDVAWELGVAGGFVVGPYASRGADLGDVDGDGLTDLVVATEREGIRLFLAEPTGHLSDRTVEEGLFRLTAGRAWFGALLEDIDLDGDPDVIATGDPGWTVLVNERGRFSEAGGLPPLPPARGAAVLDLEGDGDPDLAVALAGGGLRLLRNDVAPPEWLRVLRPVFADTGTPHPGARVVVQWPDGRRQVRESRRLRGWLSASDPAVRFARRGPAPDKDPRLLVQGPGKPELRVAWRGAGRLEGAPLEVPGSER